MSGTAIKPQEQTCQGVSRAEEPCDNAAQQFCERCRQWFCRVHFPDPEWHACAPDQGYV
jgi:hypothetical protein